jgi:lipoprotein-releasing system ATP-binding protein
MTIDERRRDILVCQNLSKAYRDFGEGVRVLNGIDLTIRKGEQLSIIGASGSGKSTLLHLLGGLDRPSTGTVLMDGKNVNRLSATEAGRLRNKTLGFVYQFHHLLPEFTAMENVAMPLLVGGAPLREAKQQAEDLLEKIGLKDRMQHKPSELSGGERQRIAIARALVGRPACILADEPTGNLDNRNAAQVFDLFLELNQEMGLAFIVVTHDHNIAKRISRVVELRDGTIHAVS